MSDIVCALGHISKQYNGVPVLEDFSIELGRGEIHAIIGDNGVGKSTLMRILAGQIPRDGGEIWLDGQKLPPYNRYQARRMGISYIAPDSLLVPDMTVLENVFLEDFPIRQVLHTLDPKVAKKRAEEAFEVLGFDVELDRPLGTLGMAERKLVLLASILCHEAKILILDEVALGLTAHEVEGFYQELCALKEHGVSIFLVTQDFKKVFEVADQITMVADGRVVWSERNTREFYDEICQKISIEINKHAFPKYPPRLGDEVLRVENMRNATALQGINMYLRKGEVVGILGAAGSGRTTLAKCIFGLDKTMDGALTLYGRTVEWRGVGGSLRKKLGFMEELQSAGLVQEMSCVENITLANVKGISTLQFIDLRLERSSAAYYLEHLGIAPHKWKRPVKELSRGEQQKVLLAKWLFSNARILLLDEPTIGLDISSRVEAYNIISELASKGVAFVIISSDIGELAGLCDRVYVMRKGRFLEELEGEELNVANMVRSISR